MKKEVPATPPPAKAPFFSTPHHAEADVAAAASTRFRACWRRKGEKAYARAWSVPVLRELRVSAGAGPAAAPRVVPWDRAAGRLRVELYAPEAASVGDDAARDIYRRAVEGDDLGLAPDGATLLGVAEVPLSKVSVDDAAAFAPDGWVHLNPPGSDTAETPTPRVRLRCLLEPAPPTPALRSASLRRRARVEALEGELEVPPFEAPPSPAVQVADESDDVVDVGVLSRLRRARATAVESQNLLRDYVRLGEQCRGLVEWSRPGASLAVFAGLTLFLVVAARMRADYLGVLVVLATMAPGAILKRRERRAARAKRSARCRRAAKKCKDAEASLKREAEALRGRGPRVCSHAGRRSIELRGARGRRRGRPRGRDERGRRAAGGDAAGPAHRPRGGDHLDALACFTGSHTGRARARAGLRRAAPRAGVAAGAAGVPGALGRDLGGAPLAAVDGVAAALCVRPARRIAILVLGLARSGGRVAGPRRVFGQRARRRRAGGRRPARFDLARAPEERAGGAPRVAPRGGALQGRGRAAAVRLPRAPPSPATLMIGLCVSGAFGD